MQQVFSLQISTIQDLQVFGTVQIPKKEDGVELVTSGEWNGAQPGLRGPIQPTCLRCLGRGTLSKGQGPRYIKFRDKM